MSSTNDTKSMRRRSAKVAAGVAISAMLALGAFIAPAQAQWTDSYGYYHSGYRHYYTGGYYRAPPVAYSGYYGNGYGYYAPPVVYGPGISLSLPFVSLGIR